jgi:homoserine dehydrogenase
MLGCGVVGAATARILQSAADELRSRAGAPLELAGVAVRDITRRRDVDLPPELLSTDPWAVVTDPSVDVVVELIGGIEPARALIVEATRRGKHVVTANKDLLSTCGEEVLNAAEAAGVDLLFEASVAGGIPVIRPIKESLAGDRIHRVMGIVNGTTNVVLTRMSDTGEDFEAALAEAAARGYTESDASADIDGHDAAAKVAILASLAFNARVLRSDVEREGISAISASDITAAHDLGYEIKLLGVAERDGGEISARVHPAMVPRTHPLASVRDVLNAVFLEADEAGELMFLGRGAGGPPTAAAVVGDIVELARNISTGGRSAGCTCYRDRARIKPAASTQVRYYVVLSVVDEPGVLSAVAGAFGDNDVSIACVGLSGLGDEATLVLITHSATQGRHDATFARLHELGVVKSIDSTIRVLGTSEG